MKEYFIHYYVVIMLALFIIDNFVIQSLKIGGLLYQLFMYALIVLNATIVIIFRKKIKYKGIVTIIYFFIWIFSKNTLQSFFDFSNIVVLCVVRCMESNVIKVIFTLITMVITICFLPFVSLLAKVSETNGIYEDTHYYCENNYEIYAYSAGAMDRYHYNIGKHYKILDIDGIMYIYYSKQNEVTWQEYKDYLKHYHCSLVGEINEFE